MLPYVIPPDPPAIIQSNNLNPLPGRLGVEELAQNPTQPPSSPPNTESIPSVVEFHYSDPENSPTDVSTPLTPPNTQGADVLGDPISADQNSVSPSPSAQTPTNDITPNGTTELILGLNKGRNLKKDAFAKIIVIQKDTAQKREFILSLDPSHTAQTLPQRIRDNNGSEQEDIMEVIADQQEYDSLKEIITARGNVTLQLSNGVLKTDRLQVNLKERLAVAEGNVVLTRGEQVIRGDRFEYYFVEDSGIVFNANGEINQASSNRDLSTGVQNQTGGGNFLNINDRLALNQPLQRVRKAGGYEFVFGTQRPGTDESKDVGSSRGQVNRLRFQADKLKFEGGRWDATDIRLTNDPFSPPELEVRAEKATFQNVAPLVDELTLTNSRMVFDQRVSVPTQNRLIFDRRDRQPTLFTFGYDGEDRGGLYVQRNFSIIDNQAVNFTIAPQYLLQKALFPDAFPTANPNDEQVDPLSPSVFGLVSNLDIAFSSRTSFSGVISFSSLNLDEVANQFRSRLRVQHKIDKLENPYLLNVEYNYRERLYNGSLGYQTVENSFGAIIISPVIPIGKTGINLTYQGSVQNVEAPTDRFDLLPPNPKDNLLTLVRTQGAATLNKNFLLWYGKPLPATPEAGLKYSPTPVLPYIQLNTSVVSVASLYSSGDTQPSLTGTIGVVGQFGHFSRSFLDYTGFSLSYSQGLRGDASPFFFDRFVDQRVISYGITQQIYGPLRFAFQSSYSLDEQKEITTDYILEWSRRTYSIVLRYNPILELGSINLRITDFNWSGNPGLFEGTLIRPVVNGVSR